MFSDTKVDLMELFKQVQKEKKRIRNKTWKVETYVRRDPRCGGEQFRKLISRKNQDRVSLMDVITSYSYCEKTLDELIALIKEDKFHLVENFDEFV